MDKLDQKPRGRPRLTPAEDVPAIKSLDRALQLLEHLGQRGEATLSELAGDLDQSPATLHRILSTCARRGFVGHCDDEQRWHIGPTAFRVGAQFPDRLDLVRQARPILARLTARTGETSALVSVLGAHPTVCAFSEPMASLRVALPRGTALPWHASAAGKCLLASDRAAPGPKREADLHRFTEATMTAMVLLRADVELAGHRGYALENQEFVVGQRALAAPVRDMDGACVAALTIAGPVSRMADTQLRALAGQVMDSAADLSAKLGLVQSA